MHRIVNTCASPHHWLHTSRLHKTRAFSQPGREIAHKVLSSRSFWRSAEACFMLQLCRVWHLHRRGAGGTPLVVGLTLTRLAGVGTLRNRRVAPCAHGMPPPGEHPKMGSAGATETCAWRGHSTICSHSPSRLAFRLRCSALLSRPKAELAKRGESSWARLGAQGVEIGRSLHGVAGHQGAWLPHGNMGAGSRLGLAASLIRGRSGVCTKWRRGASGDWLPRSWLGLGVDTEPSVDSSTCPEGKRSLELIMLFPKLLDTCAEAGTALASISRLSVTSPSWGCPCWAKLV